MDVDQEINKKIDGKPGAEFYNRGQRFEDVAKAYSLKDAKKAQRKKE